MVWIDRLRSESELSAADGVSGDPRRATVELGRIGVALIVSRTVEAIKKAVARP
jgi:creatinine amidohydrolase/Fe(II)-dependent formamide hydrolase-like protein